MTRRKVLLSVVVGLAASEAGVGVALAQGGGGDAEIMSFALTLEQLEARFYERGLRAVDGLELDEADRAVLDELRDNEADHVRVLTRLVRRLGATPVTEPQFDFGDAFESRGRFLEVAQSLEELRVAAYNGVLPTIADRQVLATAAAVVQVEARHAAAIRLLREEPFAPDAFDGTLTRRQVVRRVESFLAG